MNRVKMTQTTSPREAATYKVRAEIQTLTNQIGLLRGLEKNGALNSTGKLQLKNCIARFLELNATFENAE